MSKLWTKLDIKQKLILAIYLMIIVGGISYYFYMKITGHSISCMIHDATGLYCPGCGTTRAALALIDLNPLRALRNNAVFTVFLVVWIVISVLAFIGKPKMVRTLKFNMTMFLITVFCYMLLFVLRNLHGFEFLQPLS